MVTMMNERMDFSLFNRFGFEPILIDPAYIRHNSLKATPRMQKTIHEYDRSLELDKLERDIKAWDQHRSRLLQLVELEIDDLTGGNQKLRGLKELDKDNILTKEFAERNKGKKRMSALYQVLTTLPENDYQELKSLNCICYYLPSDNTLGSVRDLPTTATYIYLSAKLEDMTGDWIKYVVAHEFAHARLGHINRPSPHKSTEIIEEEADLKAAQWGFKRPQ